jgi:hypothetical protein
MGFKGNVKIYNMWYKALIEANSMHGLILGCLLTVTNFQSIENGYLVNIKN